MLTGASGSGKSTLLFLVGLLDDRYEGTYLFGNKDVASLSDAQKSLLRSRSFGFVFQNYNLIPNMTGTENIMLSGRYRRHFAVNEPSGSRYQKHFSVNGPFGGSDKHNPTWSLSEAKDRCTYLTQLLGVEKFAEKRVQYLSGGQQQRIAVARALFSDPDIILADEPTGNLDEENSHIILQCFDELRKNGKTILMATHADQLLPRGDRTIRL